MFRILNTFQKSGAWHMAFDEVLIRRVDAGLSEPCIRFYTWSPWCITLGSFQAAEEQLQLDRVQAAGYDVVKRPTGGRAVFHAEELTYSICAPKSIAPWGKTLGMTYDWIAAQLLAGLARVGFTGSLQRGDSSALEITSDRHLAKPPCFSSASRAEIVWEGRKLVGSAQRRSRNTFLQHGSILLGHAHRDLVNFLEFSEEQKALLRKDLQAHSVCLSEIAGVDARLASVHEDRRPAFVDRRDLRLVDVDADDGEPLRGEAGGHRGAELAETEALLCAMRN